MYIYLVLGGNLWNIWVFSIKTLFIWKKWRNGWFSYLENLTVQLTVQFFKMYLLNFGPKMQKMKIFAWVLSYFLEYPIFWVSVSLSFFGGAQKKPDLRWIFNLNRPCINIRLLFCEEKETEKIELVARPVLSLGKYFAFWSSVPLRLIWFTQRFEWAP